MSDMPIVTDVAERVEMTVSCRDTDHLPRVDNAGSVISDGDVAVQIMHNGLRVLADGYDGDWMTQIIKRLHGHHEPQEELAFHELLRHLPTEATMLELGSYWSYYSLWFLSQAPTSRKALGLEPVEKNLDVGRRNAALNGLTMDFVLGVVGETTIPEVTFASDDLGDVEETTRRQYTVVELMDLAGFDRLTVLHSDVQGAETGMLRGCRDLVRDGRLDFLVISTHSHHISDDPLTHQRCVALIEEMGGRVLVEHTVQESYSGDGLIVAYMGQEPLDWPDLRISRNRAGTALFRDPLWDLAQAREGARDLDEMRRGLDVTVADLSAENAALQDALANSERRRRQLRRRVRRLSARLDAVSATQPLPAELRRLVRRAVGGLRRRVAQR